MAHRLRCSAACGILPDQYSNPCPLHWQAGASPLRHQGNPTTLFMMVKDQKQPTYPTIGDRLHKILNIHSHKKRMRRYLMYRYGMIVMERSIRRTHSKSTTRRQGLQQRKSLFTRQPSEETGESVSDPPPQRQGAWDIYGISRVVLGVRKGEWR